MIARNCITNNLMAYLQQTLPFMSVHLWWWWRYFKTWVYNIVAFKFIYFWLNESLLYLFPQSYFGYQHFIHQDDSHLPSTPQFGKILNKRGRMYTLLHFNIYITLQGWIKYQISHQCHVYPLLKILFNVTGLLTLILS